VEAGGAATRAVGEDYSVFWGCGRGIRKLGAFLENVGRF